MKLKDAVELDDDMLENVAGGVDELVVIGNEIKTLDAGTVDIFNIVVESNSNDRLATANNVTKV